MTFLRIAVCLLVFLTAGCECAQSHELRDAGPPRDAPACPTDGTPQAGCPCDTEGEMVCGSPDFWCMGSPYPRWIVAADICGERDAGLHDAGPPAEGAFWTLEPANVDFSVTDNRCAATEGGTAVLHVQAHYFESCLSPGPIRATIDTAAHTITVRAFVWRDHDATCTPIGAAFERDVVVRDLTEGVWHVDDLHGGFDLIVDARSPAACTALVPSHEGENCFANCDCDVGLSCVAIEGDAVCASVCAEPCSRVGAGSELGLECPNDRECTQTLLSGFAVGTICTARAADLCSDTSPCPAGMACHADADATSYCDWTIELNGSTRHTCTSDSECETPGLECVHHPDGIGRCEVRCTTAEMRCPMNAPHACNELGICEWLGE